MNAEMYLAGAILIDGQKVMQAISGLVERNDFHSENCQAVFAAAEYLYSNNEIIDPVTIGNQARREGCALSNDFLAELMDCTPTAANCVDYANRVAEDARTRRVKDLAFSIHADNTSTSEELLSTLQRETDVIRRGSYCRGLLSPADSLQRFNSFVVSAGEGRRNFIPSGFCRMDDILGGGFIRGGLYVLGARPAVGKSTFAVNLADKTSGNCLFISLEMTPEQITAKRVSRITGLSSSQMLAGQVSDEEWQKIAIANASLSEKGVFINTRYDLTVQQIQILAQSVPNLGAIIIDYLGLIQPAVRSSAYENISQISRDLKRMAISLNVPVICLCQLSRAVENREDKRPRLSDLRDSGAIEQDADAVLFLYRPDYYTGTSDEGTPSLVELDIAKNRHGKCGRTEFSLWLSSNTFEEVCYDN